MIKPALVLYHAHCNDGFCAAWVALKYLFEADFIPVQYGDPPPDVKGREVYILDFSYKRDVMKRLIDDASLLVVLDHHKSAQAEFEGLDDYARAANTQHEFVFNMKKSGARLTWEHFELSKGVPWLVAYTEDRDLWRHDLQYSREVNAALNLYPHDFAVWDSLARRHPLLSGGLYTEGKWVCLYQDQLIAQLVSNASEITIAGYKVLCVNTPNLISEVAGQLADTRPFGVCWFRRQDGRFVWSLRSRNDFDVSEIAKQFGGGGHKNAAGFETHTLEPDKELGLRQLANLFDSK